MWLKLIYDPIGSPITHVEFLYFQQEGDFLKIPIDYIPVVINNDKNKPFEISKPIKSKDGVGFYKGNYDLTYNYYLGIF